MSQKRKDSQKPNSRWRKTRLKYLLDLPARNGIGVPGEFDDPEWPRYVRITDIESARKLRSDTFKSLPPDVACKALLRENDILLAAVGASFGKSYLHTDASKPACFAGFLVRISPSKLASPCFLSYWTESATYRALLDTRVVQSTIQNFSASKYSELPIELPPIDEQREIATYLDSITARIDRLISKKARLIELLREKRSALIAHTVCKGLDARAPMKDSGAEWMGSVPAHWDVVSPKAIFSQSKERAHADDQMLSATQKYGVIPLADFEALEERQVTKAEVNLEMRKHVEIGDFVISMRSMDGGLECAHASGCVRSSYSVLRPRAGVNNRYFGALLKSSLYIQALRLTSNFVRDGQDLSFTHIKRVPLPRPPVDEQVAIADYIDLVTARIDTLIAKTERSIELLGEHRTAVITAAVIGKLELREAA